MKFNLPIFIATVILLVAIAAGFLFGYILSNLIRGFLPLNILTFLVTLFLLVSVVLLVYGLLLIIKKLRSPSPSPSTSTPAQEVWERPLEEPFIRRRRLPRQLNQNSLDSQLQNRLIRMLSGDQVAAERLVNQVRLDYPGRSENWYWQKAIDNLERDRR